MGMLSIIITDEVKKQLAYIISLMNWLNQIQPSEIVWLWLTTAVLLGGLVVYFYQRRRRCFTPTCSLKPQIQPLQISCLAAQALGVQLLWQTEWPQVGAALSLAYVWSVLPYLLILGGVAGLGGLSLSCDCRDEALTREGGVKSRE
jgi:hypothetical protein